jgi:DHA1 family bicyclomycin/chloramphenicol resistance-like MFS transporter
MIGPADVQPAAPAGPPMSEPFLYGLAAALIVYGWLSVNIYLPILPELEEILETTSQTAKLTVTIFLLGFALSQLVWGPLSDRYGRKAVLLAGIAISVAGVLLAASTTNVYLFMAARFLESLGIGACPVMARSILADTLDRAHVATAMVYVVSVVALVPALAAILGGYLYLLSSWRSVFFFVALYGVGLWLLSRLRLQETAIPSSMNLAASEVAHSYFSMLKDGRYFAYVFMYCIAYGSVIGYYAISPYIFVTELDYTSHEYGYLLLVNAVCYVLGASSSRFVMAKLGTTRPLSISLVVYGLSVMLFFAFELHSTMSALGVLVPMSVFAFGSGLVSPAANAGALTMFKGSTGASAAIIGCAITLGGAVATGILAHVDITRLWQLALYVGLAALINLATYLVFLRRPPGQERAGAGTG